MFRARAVCDKEVGEKDLTFWVGARLWGEHKGGAGTMCTQQGYTISYVYVVFVFVFVLFSSDCNLITRGALVLIQSEYAAKINTIQLTLLLLKYAYDNDYHAYKCMYTLLHSARLLRAGGGQVRSAASGSESAAGPTRPGLIGHWNMHLIGEYSVPPTRCRSLPKTAKN